MTISNYLEKNEFWNARFSEPGYAYGESPNDFLRDACRHIAPGRVLSLCEGEGRNAVYLARLGFNVTAVDFSEIALGKANALAAKHGVAINTVLADLAELDLGVGRWDAVISIFAQPPSETRQRLYQCLARGLRPRGAFVLEAKVEIEATARERYPGLAILREEIGPLEIAIGKEKERELNEGRFHVGLQRTVQILAFNR